MKKLSKKIIVLSVCLLVVVGVAIACIVSFAGCGSAERMNVANIDESNVKVRVDVRGGYELVQYVTILTNDNKIISFDGHQDTEAYVVPVGEDDVVNKLMIQQCLDDLKNCESEAVDFMDGTSDLYYIEMYVGNKMYRFTYGCAKNPYANILTEILLGYSQVKEVDRITPYPSQFREAK